MGWVRGILLALHVLSCVLLVLIVLIQKDRGGGLAGAFGGGSLGTPFGIKTATVLTKATWILFAVAGLTAIALAVLLRRGGA